MNWWGEKIQKMKWKTGNERPHRLCVDRSASTVFCLIVVVLLGKPCLNPKQKKTWKDVVLRAVEWAVTLRESPEIFPVKALNEGKREVWRIKRNSLWAKTWPHVSNMAAVVMEDWLLLISLLAEATEGIQRQSKDQIEGWYSPPRAAADKLPEDKLAGTPLDWGPDFMDMWMTLLALVSKWQVIGWGTHKNSGWVTSPLQTYTWTYSWSEKHHQVHNLLVLRH